MTTTFSFLFSFFMVLLPEMLQGSVELSQHIGQELLERVCPTCGNGHLIKNGSVHSANTMPEAPSFLGKLMFSLIKQYSNSSFAHENFGKRI
jgi:hypothetical protein